MQRGETNTLECPLYASGALVAPTSGTITILDPGGTKVVDGAAVTIASSVATYTYAAPTTLDLGERYRVEWSLVVAGVDVEVTNSAEVVRRRLYCPISDVDLFRVAERLDPDSDAPITRRTEFGDMSTEAWTQTLRKLRQGGRRPDLIIEASDLREVVLYKALEIVFRNLSHSLNPAYADLAKQYKEESRDAWNDVTLVYATDDDDSADLDQPAAAPASVWLV
jgi:hypothetical protein